MTVQLERGLRVQDGGEWEPARDGFQFICYYVLVMLVDVVTHVELIFGVVRLLPHTSHSLVTLITMGILM